MSTPSPTLVVLGGVSQGTIATPTTVWIAPDRSTVSDSSVRKAKKFEDSLTVTIQDASVPDDVVIGVMLAVKRGEKYVRGVVEAVDSKDRLAKLTLMDWGEIVWKRFGDLRNIPSRLKIPKNPLAHKLVLWDGILEKEDLDLVEDIVNECKEGWLEGVGQSECANYVTGDLRIKITKDMEIFRKHKNMLQEIVSVKNKSTVTVRSLLGRKKVSNVPEKLKQTITAKLETLKKNRCLESKDHSAPDHGCVGDYKDSIDKTELKPHINDPRTHVQHAPKLGVLEERKLSGGSDVCLYKNSELSDGCTVSTHGVSVTGESVKEKLEIARRRFEEKSKEDQLSDNDINDGDNDVAYPFEAERIIKSDKMHCVKPEFEFIENIVENIVEKKSKKPASNPVEESYTKDSTIVSEPADAEVDDVGIKEPEDDSNLGSSIDHSTSSSSYPGQEFRDLVPARLELEGGAHTRFEERWGVGDTLGKMVVHRPSGSRGVKHCDQVALMEWVGSLSSYLRQSQITYSSLVQSIMWPCVSRLQSMVALAGPCQGKTLGWVLPLLNSLADRAQYSQLQQGHSPLAIVLCPGIKCASRVLDMLQDVSSKARLGVKVVLACAGARNNDPSDFINGIDILVTTPPRLLQLLGVSQLTSMNRCCHLVVEEGDRTLPMWHKEVGEIIVSWRKQRNKQDLGLPDQMIMVAEKWNTAVEQFTKTFIVESSSPVVVLANLLEAVIYGKVKVVPAFVTELDEKVDKFKTIVNGRDRTRRMIICCKDMKTSKMLGMMVAEMGEKATILNSDQDMYDVRSIFERWLDSPFSPLVVSDKTLPSLSMAGADRGTVLVHWDVPTDSKKSFSLRFIFIKSGVSSIFSSVPAQPVQVHLLLGPEDAASLNTIIPFLRRTGAVIPDKLDLFHHAVSLTKAKQSLVAGSPLCSMLITTGFCTDKAEGKCQARHFLHAELDCPPGEDRYEGVIKFMVVRVETPVMYWVRMQDLKKSKTYQKLVLGMARHFAKPESRKQLSLLERGTLVAAAGSDGVYRRARLEEMVYKVRGQIQYLDRVEVFTLDCGEKEMVKPCDLSSLPDHFGVEEYPPAVTKVVVGGVMAMDRDKDWGLQASMYVSSMMEGQGDREVVCRGKVLLHMSDIVWLDRCQVMVRQPTLGKFVCTFETKAWLIKEGFAITNKRHMELLFNMTDSASIPRPVLVDESLDMSMVEEGHEVKTRTAFLPEKELVSIYMSECFDPSHFYVHRMQFVESLNRLERDITDWVEKERSANYNFKPNEGEIVVVRCDEDSLYARARIEKVLGARQMEEEGAEPRVDDVSRVFMVDTGVTMDVSITNMAECKVEFVERMPFQALLCTLAHVKPVGKEWSKEAGDTLFDLTREVETDDALVVYCAVVEKDVDKYRVNLKNERGVNLAEELVDCGLAEWLDSSVEASFDTNEDEDKNDGEGDLRLDTLAEAANWDVPNGLPEDILNMNELYAATKEGCEEYLEHQLGSVPLQPPQQYLKSQETSCSPIVPVKLSSSSTLPPDMPSLAVVDGLTVCQSSVPHVLWSQDHQTVLMRISITSMRDITPGQVFVEVKDQELVVQVLEVDVSDGREQITIHKTPSLKLYGHVSPARTKVIVVARGINITLAKQRELFWKQLSRQKFGWIKKDTNAALNSDSDSDPELTGPPEIGFLSPYLSQPDTFTGGRHGKRYHPLTGEEILPETMWHSSDQEEEDEQLGFIHDKALEFNPDIL